MVGAWDLGPQNFSKSQLLVCGTCPEMPGSAWGFRPPRGEGSGPRRGGRGARGLGPRLANPGRQAGRSLFRKIPSKSWTPDSSSHKSSPRPKGTRARFYSPDGEDRPLWGPFETRQPPQKRLVLKILLLRGSTPRLGILSLFLPPPWDPRGFLGVWSTYLGPGGPCQVGRTSGFGGVLPGPGPGSPEGSAP